MRMEDKTILLMNQYLDRDYSVFPMAEDKIVLQDIRNIENSLAIKFPDEYVAHLLGEDCDAIPHRGIYIEVKEEIWRRPQAMAVGPFWTFLYGFHTYTASKLSADWMRLDFIGHQFMQETGLKAIPILKIINDADMYCVNEFNDIVKFNHEMNILEPTNMDFWQVWEFELKELKERKETKKSKLK